MRDPAVPLVLVTGSQRPYLFDLPHLLSLPKGFEFRFRYRHRWVQDALLTRIRNNPASLAGEPIVILFHSEELKRLVPIRKAYVLGIESLGPMVFVRFRVGEFPRTELDIEAHTPGAGAVASAETLAVTGREFLGNTGGEQPIDLSRPLPSGFYMREGERRLSDDLWDTGDDTAAWARLVAVLHTEPGLTGIPFFHLLGFRNENGASVKPAAIKNRFSVTREMIFGFQLVESERYRMRLVEWSEPPKQIEQPPVKVNCEFNAENLALEGSSNLVVGRYDVIEFTFSAAQPGYSEVAIRAEPLGKGSAPASRPALGKSQGNSALMWSEWPAIFVVRVPVVVKARFRRLIAPVISLALGLALYLVVAPRVTDETRRRLLEVVSLGFLFMAYRAITEYLDSFFKLSAAMKRLRGGPTEWAGGDKS